MRFLLENYDIERKKIETTQIHVHKSPPTSKSCGMKNISMITNTIWCFTQKWEIVPSKKTGFKVIIPKGGRGSGPNPKICCM